MNCNEKRLYKLLRIIRVNLNTVTSMKYDIQL